MTRKDTQEHTEKSPLVAIRDEDLARVAGGTMALISNTIIKAIGEALSTTARKQ